MKIDLKNLMKFQKVDKMNISKINKKQMIDGNQRKILK